MVQVADNSSFRGFLRPGSGIPLSFDVPSLGFDLGWWESDPLQGQELDDFMQQVVAGVTGIPGDLVRPRWQPEPPLLPQIAYPEDDTPGVPVWAAVGVTTSEPLGYSYNAEINPGAAVSKGFQASQDWEDIRVLCSFYGPQADRYAQILRQGLISCAQNRECLQLLNFGFQKTSGRTRVPVHVKTLFMMRVDITLFFNRQIQIFYPVLYLLKAPVVLTTDTGVTVEDGF